jgi:mannose-6-phosphate isomerase-like protein (cupin superfamily)
MKSEPVVVQEQDLAWETWEEEEIPEKGLACWKTLISGDVTPSEALTMGLAKIPPGEALHRHRHRHRQDEIYLVLEGTGTVEVGSETRPVEAGSAIFIPGNEPHRCTNTGASELRCAYVFSANSFDEIEYVFEE